MPFHCYGNVHRLCMDCVVWVLRCLGHLGGQLAGFFWIHDHLNISPYPIQVIATPSQQVVS